MVEIAKALSKQASILILDEPTSALSDKEVAELFRVIRGLRQAGVCMCYISHKMEEIAEIADRVTVLRDGRTIGEAAAISDITLDQIIERMIGRELKEMYPHATRQRGEILGISGLMGSGRTTLASAIFGAYPQATHGEVLVEGRSISIRSPADA